MAILETIVNTILNAGSTVFMPIIIMILGLIVGCKFKDALNAGILMGIALCGTSMLQSYLYSAILPCLSGFTANTGFELNILNVSWTVASAVTWAWPYVFLVFPLAFGINVLMIILGWTNTMNVDIWNYWGKAYTAALIYGFSGNLIAGFAVAALQTVLELKSADAIALPVQEMSGAPGITCTHCMFIKGALAYPIDWLLSKIPFMQKEIDMAWIGDKLGVLGQTQIIATAIGTIIALIAGNNFADAFVVGVKLATALYIFPQVAKIFMEALEPISDAASTFLREKFKGRELYVGLDWPILAGRQEPYICAILLCPITILCMLFLPNQHIMLTSVMMMSTVQVIMVLANGNLLRMLVGGAIAIPLFFMSANYLSPKLTALAIAAGQTFEGATGIALVSDDEPFFRGTLAMIFNGDTIIGIILFALYMAGFVMYYKGMMKKSKEIQAARDANN